MDKLSYLIKDFFIYLIPGLLISCCTLYLFDNFQTLREVIISNNNLAILGCLFAHIIGFLSTQFQIIIYDLYRKKTKNIYTLKNTVDDQIIKNKILEKGSLILGINQEEQLEEDEMFRSFCSQYVNLHTTTESLNLIQRQQYLSTFSISIFFPTLLSLFTLMKYFLFQNSTIFITIVLSIIILLMLINEIFNNFEKGRVKSMFLTFLSIK